MDPSSEGVQTNVKGCVRSGTTDLEIPEPVNRVGTVIHYITVIPNMCDRRRIGRIWLRSYDRLPRRGFPQLPGSHIIRERNIVARVITERNHMRASTCSDIPLQTPDPSRFPNGYSRWYVVFPLLQLVSTYTIRPPLFRRDVIVVQVQFAIGQQASFRVPIPRNHLERWLDIRTPYWRYR